MYKQLILFCIGVVINLSGIVIGYFKGSLLGAIISLVGCGIMLIGSISIAVKNHKYEKEKRAGK